MKEEKIHIHYKYIVKILEGKERYMKNTNENILKKITQTIITFSEERKKEEKKTLIYHFCIYALFHIT